MLTAGCLGACKHQTPPLHEPNSVESLCLTSGAPRQKAFKLPSIEAIRNDRLIKGQDLHVDLDAAQRVVAETVVGPTGKPVDEDDARAFVMRYGGGVIVWWRGQPVAISVAVADPKGKPSVLAVEAAAIAEMAPWQRGRLLYLLARPATEANGWSWRAFSSADQEKVCL